MNDRPSVLIVIGQLEIGGTERHLVSVLPQLRDDSLDVTVYCLRGGGALESSLTESGIRVISPAHHSRGWLGVVRTAIHFIKSLRHLRPTFTHFFLPEAYLLGGLCSLVAAPKFRIMSRRSLNDYQQRRPWSKPIERFLHKKMDCLLGNSRAVVRQLLEEGADPRSTALIYNGVAPSANVDEDATKANSASLDIPGNATILAVVANLIPYKGHGDLFEALARVNDAVDGAWILLVIGNDLGIQRDLEHQARRLGIAANLRWVGTVADVDPFLAITDILVSPSHEEGFSNAILEAMAAGVPAIVTDVGGSAEAILDGECGIVVPPRNPARLSAAIVDLIQDNAKLSAYGAAARERAGSHFSLQRAVRQYRTLYLAFASRGSSTVADIVDGVS